MDNDEDFQSLFQKSFSVSFKNFDSKEQSSTFNILKHCSFRTEVSFIQSSADLPLSTIVGSLFFSIWPSGQVHSPFCTICPEIGHAVNVNINGQHKCEELNVLRKKNCLNPITVRLWNGPNWLWFLTDATLQRVKTGSKQGSYANRHLPYCVTAGQS